VRQQSWSTKTSTPASSAERGSSTSRGAHGAARSKSSVRQSSGSKELQSVERQTDNRLDKQTTTVPESAGETSQTKPEQNVDDTIRSEHQEEEDAATIMDRRASILTLWPSLESFTIQPLSLPSHTTPSPIHHAAHPSSISHASSGPFQDIDLAEKGLAIGTETRDWARALSAGKNGERAVKRNCCGVMIDGKVRRLWIWVLVVVSVLGMGFAVAGAMGLLGPGGQGVGQSA
jgi:hypothetical protein